ncbi:MAG: sugar phosphate nucleotidyltransferase, partial [Bacillota bacterium]
IKYSDFEDRVYTIEDLVEKPSAENAPSNLAILGRYVITSDIFDILEETEPGRKGEIQLTDALKTLSGKRSLKGYDFIGKRYDVGNKIGFLKATVEFALQRDDLNEEFNKYLTELLEKKN